jgi:hypothetical protein
MVICEFCIHQMNRECGLGLKVPRGMACREFVPILDGFCSNHDDFVGPNQIIQMATYFGFKGVELKKVKRMAAREEEERLLRFCEPSSPRPAN